MKFARFVCSFLLFAIATALAQNPIPFINQPVVPDAVAPGGPSFTLTVNGSEFVSTSVVNWNGAPLSTTFVNSTQLTARVPATDIAIAGTVSISVTSPAPGGGTSGPVYLSVTNPAESLTFTNYAENFDFAGTVVTPVPMAEPVTGDFNGDGRLDVAFLGAGGNGNTLYPVCIGLGNGDGSFQIPNCTAPVNVLPPLALLAADFNGDGKLDLAVLNPDPVFENVLILLGNGDGTLQAPQTISPIPNGLGGGFTISAFAVGDFNRDGKLDLAVALSNFDGYFSVVSILLGNGDGTFQSPVVYTLPFSDNIDPTILLVGDFNGDGNLDLAVNYSEPDNRGNYLYVGLGNGDGTFQPAQVVATLDEGPGGQPRYFDHPAATADLNGDGNLDLVMAWSSSYDVAGFFVLLGNGDGTFQAPANYSVPYSAYGSPVLADVNADGKLDLLLALWNQGNNSENVTQMSVLLGNGDGTFQAPTNLPTPALPVGGNGGPDGLLAGDFNGDGKVDILLPYDDCAINPACNSDFGPDSYFFFLQGLFPVPVVTPASLGFSGQVLNITSSPQSVTLTNSGLAALTVTGISLGGQNPPGQFAQTNTCGPSVAVGAFCQINVTYTPTVVGNASATLVVGNNGIGNSQDAFPVTGSTQTPEPMTLTPANVLFPSQYVGTSGLPQTVTVTNTSSITLTISNVTTSTADFGTLSNCTSSLPPNTECTIGVFFDPMAAGTRNGTLAVTSNATNSPQSVALSGAAEDFSMTSSGSATATVSPGGTATYALAIAPAGGFNGTVSFTCSGAPVGFVCSVPSSVALNGTAATNVTVTVTSEAAALAQPSGLSPLGSKLAMWLAFGGLPGLVILSRSGVVRRRGNRRILFGLALLCLFSLAIVWIGCGGGNNGGGGGAGTYNLTVTGKFSSGATTLSHNTNLTLVVK